MFAFWGLTWSILQERLKSPQCLSVSPHCRHRMMDTFCGGGGSIGRTMQQKIHHYLCQKWDKEKAPVKCAAWFSAPIFALPAFSDELHVHRDAFKDLSELTIGIGKRKTLFKVFIIWEAQRIPECCFIWYQLSLSELIQFIMQSASSRNNPTQYASMSPGPGCEERRPPVGAWSDWPWAVCCVLL